MKGSTALLGDPVDVCKFEVILGGEDQRTKDLTQKLMWAYYQALQKEFGSDVRLHFGHHIPKEFEAVAKQDLAASFKGAKKFAEIRKRFDPDGRFLNPWQEKLLPDAHP